MTRGVRPRGASDDPLMLPLPGLGHRMESLARILEGRGYALDAEETAAHVRVYDVPAHDARVHLYTLNDGGALVVIWGAERDTIMGFLGIVPDPAPEG